MGTMDMVALFISDGYLVGAVREDTYGNPWSAEYWPLEWREGFDGEDDWELVQLVDVPSGLAEQLEAMSTSEQWFDDGYEAAQAAQPYIVYSD